ncbi:MAG: response regulator [Myxococcales bacterium]|nr:response regulator [Myxococcales bacterium]
MSAGGDRSNPNSLLQIDRRLAVAFMLLASALMVGGSIATALMYGRSLSSQREELARVIAHSMGPAFATAKKAGEYRLVQLARDIRAANPSVAYIRLVDGTGALVAEGWDAPPPDDDMALLARLSGPDAPLELRHLELGMRPLTEVNSVVLGGYEGEWSGLLRVGIQGEPLQPLLLRLGLSFAGVAALMLALAWPVFLYLGRRLGAPIKILARDFEGVMQHAPLYITIEDADGVVAQASEAFMRTFGLARGAHPRLDACLPAEALTVGAGEQREVRVPVGGEERVLLVNRFPVLLSESGAVLRQGLIGMDVTAWRKDQAQRDQLAAAVENTDDQLLVTVPTDGIVYANPAFLGQTGYSEAEVLGRRPSSLLVRDDSSDEATQRSRAALLSAFVGQGSWRGRIVARKKDGTPFDCDLLMSPIQDERGVVQAQVWIGRDVSREVQLQAQLRESQKMEAVGRLAGGLAHDFNNLLTVIGGVTALMQEEPLDEEMQSNLRMVADASRRATDLTRQLLAFGRRQVMDIQDVDLNRVVDSTLPLLLRMVRPDVELVFTPGKGIWQARGDLGQIEQVLLNLTINASDAMPKGGQIRIHTENTTLAAGTAHDGAVVKPGDYVVLVVSDTGEGISPQVLPKIFEPFFTTKRLGQGTGLGLATVHGVVRQTGGHIFVDSVLGEGTTFRVALPRVSGPVVTSRTPAFGTQAPPRGAGEHILVAEDDPGVRAVVARILEQGGYEVLTAPDGEAALALLEERGPVDLLLTDLMMPRMGGVALAEALHTRSPGLPVLFMSGYSEDMVATGDLGLLIQKPPAPHTLLSVVHHTLAARTVRT